MKASQIFSITAGDTADKLYEAIASITSATEARQFLQDLCTPAEIQAMADRWRVVGLIKQQKSYRQISQETGVSVTTIGRVARCIMFGANGYNAIYQRLEQINQDVETTICKEEVLNQPQFGVSASYTSLPRTESE
jgi:TrpR-related protein YerC/YecD